MPPSTHHRMDVSRSQPVPLPSQNLCCRRSRLIMDHWPKVGQTSLLSWYMYTMKARVFSLETNRKSLRSLYVHPVRLQLPYEGPAWDCIFAAAISKQWVANCGLSKAYLARALLSVSICRVSMHLLE